MAYVDLVKPSFMSIKFSARYLKLAVLVIVAGNIYPLIYLRQNFELSMLEAFGITAQQLGQNYAMLGILYVVTYIPSGWLADRVSPRILMSFSLLLAGVLGLWFSTYPGFVELQIIYAGWGIAAGLTFWSALIKATTLLAAEDEQAKFFGILEAGRGLVEALLATIAVAILAYYLQTLGQDTPQALQKVIYMYVACMLVLAPISYFILADNDEPQAHNQKALNNSTDQNRRYWADIKSLITQEELWLCGVCILMGYQLFWASYSYSAYMQSQFSLTAVMAGTITVIMLWMRTIGATVAGFMGDKFVREKVLGLMMALGAILLLVFTFMPLGVPPIALMANVAVIGLLMYGIRGIFWSTLSRVDVRNEIKGLAIGIVSIVGYSPDIYLPKLNGYLLGAYPGREGYTIYFCIIAVGGLIGALAAWRLHVIVQRKAKREIKTRLSEAF